MKSTEVFGVKTCLGTAEHVVEKGDDWYNRFVMELELVVSAMKELTTLTWTCEFRDSEVNEGSIANFIFWRDELGVMEINVTLSYIIQKIFTLTDVVSGGVLAETIMDCCKKAEAEDSSTIINET